MDGLNLPLMLDWYICMFLFLVRIFPLTLWSNRINYLIFNSLFLLRCSSADAALWGGCPWVLWGPQSMETGGYHWDCGPIRLGLHHPQWQWPPQVHPSVRHSVEVPQEHPCGPRVGNQWNLSNPCSPSLASRSECQVPASKQGGPLHTREWPLQCWEWAEKRRRGSSPFSKIHRCFL